MVKSVIDQRSTIIVFGGTEKAIAAQDPSGLRGRSSKGSCNIYAEDQKHLKMHFASRLEMASLREGTDKSKAIFMLI